MAPSSLLCLTCSSTISLTGGPSLPAHNEKPDPPAELLSCSTHWVCGRCIRKNPRLARGCLLCEDVLGSVASKSTVGVVRNKMEGELPRYDDAEEAGFVIGDLDEDEDNVASSSGAYEKKGFVDAPPGYDEEPVPPRSREEEAPSLDLDPVAEKRQAAQPNIHYILPEETLLGLSMRYKVPVSPDFFSNSPLLANPRLARLTPHQKGKCSLPSQQTSPLHAFHYSPPSSHAPLPSLTPRNLLRLHLSTPLPPRRKAPPHPPTLPSHLTLR